MKILIAVDNGKYSEEAVREGARLAANTWAEVTVLGVSEKGGDTEALKKKVSGFCHEFAGEDSPYGAEVRPGFEETAAGVWETGTSGGRKSVRGVVCSGRTADVISDRVREEGVDLLIIGAAPAGEPQWAGDVNLPRRVAAAAECSVLVVKESHDPGTVVTCLDHDQISQESLELINQLVTLHGADLKVVGISGAKGLDDRVQKKMNEVVSYYAGKDIRALVRMAGDDDLETFIRKAAETSLIGIWYGRKSLFRKIFSKDRLEQLVDAASHAVLVLK